MKASQPGRWVHQGQHMQPRGNMGHNARASRRRRGWVLPGHLASPLLKEALHKICLHCYAGVRHFLALWDGPVQHTALRSSSPESPHRSAHVSGRTHRNQSLSRITVSFFPCPPGVQALIPHSSSSRSALLMPPIPSVLVCPSVLLPLSPEASV